MSKRSINFMTTSPPSKVQHIVPITPHSNDKAQSYRPYQHHVWCDDDDNDDNEDNTNAGNDDDDDDDYDEDDEDDNNNHNKICHLNGLLGKK